jgi:hypothetical protein
MSTEYHKIETLYERDERTFKLKPELILKNPVYGLINKWRWTEKVDGTNIRAIWQNGGLHFGGKTDQAQIHADLVKWLYEHVTPQALAACFAQGEDAVVYGEGYGAGIQKGGGLYSAEKRFMVFDVFVPDAANPLGGWWLSDDNVADVACKLGLDCVPYFGEYTLEHATVSVRGGITSRIGPAPHPAEGLVGRPVEALFDKKGHRLIVKLKTKDFAAK